MPKRRLIVGLVKYRCLGAISPLLHRIIHLLSHQYPFTSLGKRAVVCAVKWADYGSLWWRRWGE
jgi:hypothetical protein